MRVQIDVNFESSATNYFQVTSLPDVVNVAHTEDLDNARIKGAKGFQLSPNRANIVCTLNNEYNFFSAKGYRGILTRVLSDSNGELQDLPVITYAMGGNTLSTLYITFDHVSKEYATEILLTVDGNSWTLVNDAVNMSIDMQQYAVLSDKFIDIQIAILKWSKPHASVKISQIALSPSIIFSENAIQDFTCSENMVAGQAYTQPGIIEQYAEIRLYDREGYIRKLTKDNSLFTNAKVNMLVYDGDTPESIGSYKVNSWDINLTDTNVKILCGDFSAEFNDIIVNSINVAKVRTVDDMLKLLFLYARNYQWRYYSDTDAQYCKSIHTPNSWFRKGTLHEQLTKVCTLGMLCIYWYVDTFIVKRLLL